MAATPVGIGCLTVIPFPKKLKKLLDGSEILVTENPTLDWHRHFCSLVTPVNWNSSIVYPEGMLVDEARNWAVERARELNSKYLFFVDYDVLVPGDALTRLTYDMEQYPDADIFCGVYCSKSDIPQPLIFRGDGQGAFWDWKIGEIKEITGCHMGLTLIRMSAFDKIDANPIEGFKPGVYFKTRREHRPSGAMLGTEDLFMTNALNYAGGKIYADCQVIAGHQDMETHRVYGLPRTSKPVATSWMAARDANQSIALDLGCADAKNEFPGYDVTFGLDGNESYKPDYVCSLRHIPFPDDLVDFIYASHVLEHFGRWEVMDVLSEWVRVLKPGGKMKLVVPNILWAAKRLIELDGMPDMDVTNVFYGAQDVGNVPRDTNSHYIGFTPKLLIETVTQSGLEIQSTEYDELTPAVGYNIIIDAIKPKAEEPAYTVEPLLKDEAASANGSPLEGAPFPFKILDKV